METLDPTAAPVETKNQVQFQTKEQIAKEISIRLPMISRTMYTDFFQSVNIPPAQIFAIMTLYELAPCRLTTLADEMHIAAPTATGIIDRLEQAGYVKREQDKDDRRAVNITLTTHGVHIAKNLRLVVKDKWQGVLEKLPLEDCQEYLRILKRVQELLNA